VPVWYRYEPGDEVRFVTGSESRKVALIRKAGRVSLCVQSETPPYQYVTVEGPAEIGTPDWERDVREVAVRYLGAQMGEVYLTASAAELAQGVLVRVRPERWLTADFGKWSP
jgi:PPOX class probable F420-dependent enzyme